MVVTTNDQFIRGSSGFRSVRQVAIQEKPALQPPQPRPATQGGVAEYGGWGSVAISPRGLNVDARSVDPRSKDGRTASSSPGSCDPRLFANEVDFRRAEDNKSRMYAGNCAASGTVVQSPAHGKAVLHPVGSCSGLIQSVSG